MELLFQLLQSEIRHEMIFTRDCTVVLYRGLDKSQQRLDKLHKALDAVDKKVAEMRDK